MTTAKHKTQTPMGVDLYREAVTEGIRQYRANVNRPVHAATTQRGPQGPGYWIARYAAREAAAVLLIKARDLGVSDQILEALRQTAADVAYD